MLQIAQVLFPPDVVEKVFALHRLTQWEIEQVIFDPQSQPRWEVHPKHGGRVIIRGKSKGHLHKDMFAALRPIDAEAGVWACITAFFPTSEEYGVEEEGL